jgi:hypothetical protein
MSENILQLLERYVAIYRRLPKPDPPPQWDTFVLAQAQKAVRPTKSQRKLWPRWAASAAVVCVAVGLGWQMRHNPISNPLPDQVFSQRDLPQPTEKQDKGISLEPQSSNAIRVKDQQEPDKAEPNPAAPAADARSRQVESTPESARYEVTGSRIKPVNAMPPPSVSAMPENNSGPEAKSIVTESAPMLEAEAFPKEAREQTAKKTNTSASPAQTSAAEARSETDDRQAKPKASHDIVTPAKTSVAPLINSNDQSDGASEDGASEIVRASASSWIEHIHDLLKQGQRERAREELKQWREHYPNTPVPKDLEELLH